MIKFSTQNNQKLKELNEFFEEKFVKSERDVKNQSLILISLKKKIEEYKIQILLLKNNLK